MQALWAKRITWEEDYEDQPGTLANLGEALGKAGDNIGGSCGFPSEGKGVIHILVQDAVTAR